MILDTDDVNRQVDIFISIFIECLDACAPYVTKEIKRPFAPWMNDDLKEAMKLRNETHKKLKSDRMNFALQEQYKREKRQVKNLIAKTKAEYYNNKFKENRGKTAKTWKTIREIVPTCKNNANDCNFEDKTNKANAFNVHFVNVRKNTFEKNQELLHGGSGPYFNVPYFNVPYFNDANIILDGVTIFRPQPVDT